MELNRDTIMVRMAELQIGRRQLAELAGLSYETTCRKLASGEADPVTVGKLAHALNIEVEKIAKAKEVTR